MRRFLTGDVPLYGNGLDPVFSHPEESWAGWPALQGYLADKKPLPPRILQWAYAQGPMVVLGVWAFSYKKCTPLGTYRRPAPRVLGGL